MLKQGDIMKLELKDGEIITLEKAGEFEKFGFKDGDSVKIVKIDEAHFRMIRHLERG